MFGRGDVALQEHDGSQDYQAGLAIYEAIGDRVERAERPEDFVAICRKLAEARFLMARCRSRAEGTAPRTVPACAADAAIVEADGQPDPRLVPSGRQVVPFWDAPDEYAFWFQGYFGSGEDCVPARMLDASSSGRTSPRRARRRA